MQWNRRKIELPVCSEEDSDIGKVNDGWVPKLYYYQRLLSKRQLWEEIAIIHRILYKNTLQHRKSAHLRKLIELSRCLKRFQELGLAEIFNHIIPTKTDDKNVYKLPSREMVSFFLTRLVGGYKLLSKTINVLEDTYIAFHTILRQALFMPFALIVLCSTSRLHIYLQYLLKEMNICYKTTYHWMSTLKQVKNKEFEIGLTENIDDIVLHTKSMKKEFKNYQNIQNAIESTSKEMNDEINEDKKIIAKEEEEEEEEEEEKPIIIEETNNELSSSFWSHLDSSDDNKSTQISNSFNKPKELQKSEKSKESNKKNKKALKQKKKNAIKSDSDNIIDNIFDSLPFSISNKNKDKKEQNDNDNDEDDNNNDDDVNGLDLIDKLFSSVKDKKDMGSNKNKKNNGKINESNKDKKENLNNLSSTSVTSNNNNINNNNNNNKNKKKKRKFSDTNKEEKKDVFESDDIDMIFSGKVTTKTVVRPLDKLKNNSDSLDQKFNNMNKKMKKSKNKKQELRQRNKKDIFESTTDSYLEKVLKHQEEIKDEEDRQNNILDRRMREMKKNKKLKKRKNN